MFKYTLVPNSFFSEEESRKLLSDVVALEHDEAVEYKELPGFQAVLLYAVPSTSSAQPSSQSSAQPSSRASAQPSSQSSTQPSSRAERSDLPLVLHLLDLLTDLKEYTKVVAGLSHGSLHIVVAAREKLLLCNSFMAQDNVTAEYYIFAALKQFQINPEAVNLRLYGKVPDEMVLDLRRYFQEVTLCG